MPTTTPFSTSDLRKVLGAFVTGVTVITTLDQEGRRHGLTANSFNSVSLDPPLILWSQSLSSASYPVFRDAERFVVNILAENQVDVSNRFAKPLQDKFAGIDLQVGIGGIPLIRNCAGYLQCRKETSYLAGDHAVFLGRVEAIRHTGLKPLAFGQGKYLVAHPHDLGSFSLDLGVASPGQLRAVRSAIRALSNCCKRIDETLLLSVWGNHGPTVIFWEESSHPLIANPRPGLVLPMLTSATGLAFAAFLPPALTAPFIEAELAHTASVERDTPRTWEELERVLAKVREKCLARVAGQSMPAINLAGIDALSAPVFDRSGLMVFAFTAVGRSETLDSAWEGPVALGLKESAAALSRRLGFKPAKS